MTLCAHSATRVSVLDSTWTAILGGFTVYLIENIIVILNVSAFWKEVVIGLFLLSFVVVEFYRRRKAASVLL